MKLNKKLLVATAVSAMMMVACSEDSKSSTEPENETPSSEVQDPTSSAEPGSATGSSGSAPATSSNSTGTSSESSLISSSSVANTDPPVMGCSEIMYNAPDGSALEWVEIYIAGGMDMDNMQNFLLHLSGAIDYTFPAEPLKKG